MSHKGNQWQSDAPEAAGERHDGTSPTNNHGELLSVLWPTCSSAFCPLHMLVGQVVLLVHIVPRLRWRRLGHMWPNIGHSPFDVVSKPNTFVIGIISWRMRGPDATQVMAWFGNHRRRFIILINHRLQHIPFQAKALAVIGNAAVCVDQVKWPFLGFQNTDNS